MNLNHGNNEVRLVGKTSDLYKLIALNFRRANANYSNKSLLISW
ncbi:hypothetical protein Lser_V15G10036 [Lactuca serriola]